jgi:hypothetical protein
VLGYFVDSFCFVNNLACKVVGLFFSAVLDSNTKTYLVKCISVVMKTLPDQNHINEIARRLWCDREFGKAAVMVGSGFSRNAKKLSPSAPDFPLWNHLKDELINRLYPNASGDTTSDVIALAGEFEGVFGRQSLNSLLLDLIPDSAHAPGDLHKLLMNLPWSDVFTTNYDTLLERTCPLVHGRKYDVVQTRDDLTRMMRPRIVKLHGSFPAHSPFIFTQEDYRTYPEKFAPFVNTVQQSMMENTFCLLGFSGTDPNFLNWVGWIRDKLGESVPLIYLCGLLNISNSNRQLLMQKKIIPVDLSPLFPDRDDPFRHYLATAWFLESLRKSKPLDVSCWPNEPSKSDKSNFEFSDRLPEISVVKSVTWSPGQLNPRGQQIERAEILRLLKDWEICRHSYPGWVVAPPSKRQILWIYTRPWIDPILHAVNELEPVLSLAILYELNWRMEKSLTPLMINWEEVISRILLQVNPFPGNSLPGDKSF